jgi:hypothetical protein
MHFGRRRRIAPKPSTATASAASTAKSSTAASPAATFLLAWRLLESNLLNYCAQCLCF